MKQSYIDFLIIIPIISTILSLIQISQDNALNGFADLLVSLTCFISFVIISARDSV